MISVASVASNIVHVVGTVDEIAVCGEDPVGGWVQVEHDIADLHDVDYGPCLWCLRAVTLAQESSQQGDFFTIAHA